MISDTSAGSSIAAIREASDDYEAGFTCTPILATLENETSFVDIVTAICTLVTSLSVSTTKALCRLLCLANATPA